MDPKPAKIGKYDVVDVIGRGGMGIVYKGSDPHLGRLVAIKMMTGSHTDNPEFLKRFYREAQSTGGLQHPNIVTVYELGDHGGNPYLVMEYLQGESLDSIIKSRQPLGLLEKINLIIEVCQGLNYAHHRDIVHRDVKPANIMVLSDGGVKIVDFGIAHIGDKTVTRTGQIMGSLSYMSPEQVNGKIVDARSDLFSTGVVLYELLTYTLPFEGETTASTLLKIIHEPPPPMRKYISQVYPTELEDIVLRALAKDRENRYQSAEDLAFDLGQVRDQMKREVVEQYMNQAELLMTQQQFLKAREQLFNVLKMDRQHSRAMQLMRSVSQKIQHEETSEQVRKLRDQAEDALLHEQFEAALGFIEKALALNRTDAELVRLRASIQQAKTRVEELQVMLQRADSAHQQGDLDLAKQAIEEALGFAPNDIHAKALYRVIHRDWVERSRQRQLSTLLESARKEIASRRFTAALDLLKQAENIDSKAPQLQALLDSAKAGREQELRRKELENINHEIEAALDREDFHVACAKADEGLRRFPDDRGLQKLKALADKQRQVVERQRFVDGQLAKARSLMESGRAEEALTLLQAAVQTAGADPHLHSMLAVARETVQRQRAEARKADYLHRAKDALRRKEYDDAVATLSNARAELGGMAEIDDLLQLAEEQAATQRRRKIADVAAEKAQALLAAEEYDKAIGTLKTALLDAPEEDLQLLLAEAERGASEFKKNLEAALSSAQQMLQVRKAGQALQHLESQPASFSRDASFRSLLQRARALGDLLRQVEKAREQSRELLDRNDFNGALRALEECSRTFGPAPEIESFMAEVERRRSAKASELVQEALADGRVLMGAAEYRAVLDRLNTVSEHARIASPALQAECKALHQQATLSQARQYKTQVEQLISSGDHLQATDLLQQALSEFPQNCELLEMNKVLDGAVQNRREAQKLLSEAQQFFRRSGWREGAELCSRVTSHGESDPLVHKQLLTILQQAAQSAITADWRSAEILSRQLGKLQPNLQPDASLQAQIENGKRQESILACLNEAKRLHGKGDLRHALLEIERGLLLFPGETSLLELQQILHKVQKEQEEHARLERERVQRAAYLKEIRERLQREPAPDSRILVLEEALRTYPDEVALQQELTAAQTLWNRVTSLAHEAMSFEQARKFPEAVQCWHSIRGLDPRYPGLASTLERLRHLQEEARNAARANYESKIQAAISAFDLEEGASVLFHAEKDFAGDRQLEECKRRLEERVSARQKALKLAAEAEKLFAKQRWPKALDSIRRALEVSGGDPLVRQQAQAELINAAELTVATDWLTAEAILQTAAELQPASPEVGRLQAAMERHKREKIVNDCLSAAAKAESTGNLREALTQVERGLLVYSDEIQLIQRKITLENALRAAEQARQRESDIADRLESARRLRSIGDLQGGLRLVEQALTEFPAEPQLLAMESATEAAIQEFEKRQRRREEEQRAREEENRRRQEQQKLDEQRRSEERKTAIQARPHTEVPLISPARTGTLSASYADIPGWQADALKLVERELAFFIGPLAAIIVYRAACRTSDTEEFYSLLASSLEKETDRQAFLARKAEVFRTWGITQLPTNVSEAGEAGEPTATGLTPEFTPETIERAAAMLAPYVGPISRVLVKKAARRADNLRSLYLILAEHLEKKSERASFLRDSGFTDS